MKPVGTYILDIIKMPFFQDFNSIAVVSTIKNSEKKDIQVEQNTLGSGVKCCKNHDKKKKLKSVFSVNVMPMQW